MPISFRCLSGTVFSVAAALNITSAAQAQPLNFAPLPLAPAAFHEIMPGAQPAMPQEQAIQERDAAQVPDHLRRRIVAYRTNEASGTIVIDTTNTHLYYVLGNGQAVRYGIGVGREGFTWSGVKSVARKAEWPDWTPPQEMLARQPYLPRFMAGGPGNPLGARAMYLSGSLYRIHGTNVPSSIGKQVSSGCIRMLNEDVVDLYERAQLGAKVVVLRDSPRTRVASR